MAQLIEYGAGFVRAGFIIAVTDYYHNDVIGLDLPREVPVLNRSVVWRWDNNG